MNTEVSEYVAGFMLQWVPTLGNHMVLLVRKNRPQWQAGLLNGVGGKIEKGENPSYAMEREFKEETGGEFSGWRLFAKEEGPDYNVYFYRIYIDQESQWRASDRNDVGEELVWLPVNTKEVKIGNLNWLIPLALDPRDIVVLAKTLTDIRNYKTW
jgi:8-oxo-dGTP diphosphatase